MNIFAEYTDDIKGNQGILSYYQIDQYIIGLTLLVSITTKKLFKW